MNESTILFFLVCIIVVLLIIVFGQWYCYTKGVQKNINHISAKLRDILESGSDEKIMVFTGDNALKQLCGQINGLLLDRQRIKRDYRQQEITVKKMLANISHDIKTPLTVILGYLEIMRLHRAEDEELQKVEQKAKQVLELINAFFSLAKLEAGDSIIELAQVNVSELCRECILGFYEMLREAEFEVELSIPEKDLFVWGEEEAVQRILWNLISNVIRYGADGNYMGLMLRTEQDYVLIDIVDKGKGIGKEFADNVFDRLYTMEDSRNRHIQGNGLGLTIARNLARQMGGEIALQSEPNVQTVFTVKLAAWTDENDTKEIRKN